VNEVTGRPLRTVLVEAERRLANAQVPSPRADAELLLAHVLGVPRSRLVLSADVDSTSLVRFESLLAKRAARRPLQHLLGEAPFRYATVAVGPGVFVPRPETEIVAEAAIRLLRGSAQRLVVDLCSGSGVLGLCLATEVPATTVHLVERDPAAMAWLTRNAADFADRVAEVGSLVVVHQADAASVHLDALASLVGTVDLVTCNPPYIPEGAFPRDPEVREFDPPTALYGGPDGLDVIRAVAVSAGALLRPGGTLVMEHGDTQGESAGDLGVPAVLRAAGYCRVEDRIDLAGRDRYAVAVRGGE
jgi:release factor glutamine methyltransferase